MGDELSMFMVYCCSLHKSISWKVLFILQQNVHTKKFWLGTDCFFFILQKKFLYGSYLKQIWQHFNEQYSPQMHLSCFLSQQWNIPALPGFCETWTKSLLFIIHPGKAGMCWSYRDTFPFIQGKAGSYLHFPRQGISFDRDRTRLSSFQFLLPTQKFSFV